MTVKKNRWDRKQGREILFPLSGPIGEIINRRYLEVGGRAQLGSRGSGGGTSASRGQ